MTKELKWGDGSTSYHYGTYLGQKVLLVQSGIGGKNIRRSLRNLPLDHKEIRLAINIGCTGSLVRSMRIAHLNIPCQIRLHMKETMNYIPDKRLLSFARSAAMSFKRSKAHFLPSLTVKKAFNRKDKLALHTKAPDLGCIDLESYHFARFFSQSQIPYLIVRSVSDTWNLQLPPVPYLSLSCWKRWNHMPIPTTQLPNILRFHLGVILSCWINQRFIDFLIRRIRILED